MSDIDVKNFSQVQNIALESLLAVISVGQRVEVVIKAFDPEDLGELLIAVEKANEEVNEDDDSEEEGEEE